MAGVSPRGIFVSYEARATSGPAGVCKEGATTWDAKRAAVLRVAPRKPWGFVVRPSQTAAGRLRPHASPPGFLGATQHPRWMRHDTRPEQFSWTGSDGAAGFPARRGVSEVRADARPLASERRRMGGGRSSQHDRSNQTRKRPLKRVPRQGKSRHIEAERPYGDESETSPWR